MEKRKGFLGIPKRVAVIGVCLAAFLVILGAVAFATKTVAVETAIGEEKAENLAFADLGIDPLSAQNVHTEIEYEQGQFVYEVTFMAEGTEYEYWIKATDGTVVKKRMDLVAEHRSQQSQASQDAEADAQEKEGSQQSQASQDAEADAQEKEGSQQGQASQDAGADAQEKEGSQQSQASQGTDLISLEKAKELALSDAGVSQAEAVFTKTELDRDSHIAIYEVKYYTSSHEYEYEVDASTGEIRSRDKEIFENKSGKVPEGGENANTGVEQAKSIAASHAGFSVSDITFSKVKLEEEDGQAVYEIKFYKDSIEYEYEISAASGEVLKFESERDD